MKKRSKIDAMYDVYGCNEGAICKDCCNLIKLECGNKRVYKCKAYGITSSEASDWRLRNVSCGLYNMPFDTKYTPVMLRFRRRGMTPSTGLIIKPEDLPTKGQLSIDEL